MKTTLAIVAPALLIAACASTGQPSSGPIVSSPTTYWSGASSSSTEFRRDNVLCSARASKAGNVAAPDNRIDRSPQKWTNAEAQQVYDSCMLDQGWRPASS